MIFSFHLSPAAEADISRIILFYSEISAQIVKKIEAELQHLKGRLEIFPLSCPLYSKRVRRATLHIVPYNLYYEFVDGCITVAAVLPQRFSYESIGERLLES